MNNKPITHDELRQFTGTTHCYAHPLNRRVLYSDGVKFLADQAEAHWLIDAIASYFGSDPMKQAIARDMRLATLQFWRLERQGNGAVLTAVADSGEPPFITQHIPFTDFPLDFIDIWAGFDGVRWLLYLPSEH